MRILMGIVLVMLLGGAVGVMVVARRVERVRKMVADAKVAKERRTLEQGLPAELEYVLARIDRELDRLRRGGEEPRPGLAERLDELRSVLVRNHDLRPLPFSPAEVCREETAAWSAMVPGREVSFDCPAAAIPLRVSGDPELFRWALRELFSNARAHGGEWSRVGVRLEPAQDRIAILVEDDGRGPDPITVARFYGAFTPRIGSSGPGLGLFAVRTIVERIGGSVKAAPGRDGGLIHKVRLPVHRESPGPGGSAPA